MNWTSIAIVALVLTGCAATQLRRDAERVRLTNAAPEGCQYIGEAIGSQGNWATGDYTPTQNLIQGARNDLRNKAASMGGDTVQLENTKESGGPINVGTSNVVAIGQVYRCN